MSSLVKGGSVVAILAARESEASGELSATGGSSLVKLISVPKPTSLSGMVDGNAGDLGCGVGSRLTASCRTAVAVGEVASSDDPPESLYSLVDIVKGRRETATKRISTSVNVKMYRSYLI